ncbi:hypothetical protein LXL04_020929 [Taraxacum kok-saghyz]
MYVESDEGRLNRDSNVKIMIRITHSFIIMYNFELLTHLAMIEEPQLSFQIPPPKLEILSERVKSDASSLWAKLILAIHGSPRVWKFFPVRLGTAGVWKNIVSVTKDFHACNIILRDLCHKDLRAGNQTSFWFKDWSGFGIFKGLFPNLFKLESRKHCSVADRYLRLDESMLWVWDWKREPSSFMEKIELSCCNLSIQSISLVESVDCWRWLGDTSSSFSVSSLRRLLESFTFPELPYKHFWNNQVPLKIHFFGWRAVLNRLPSKSGLAKRGIPLPSTACAFCGSHECWNRNIYGFFKQTEFWVPTLGIRAKLTALFVR